VISRSAAANCVRGSCTKAPRSHWDARLRDALARTSLAVRERCLPRLKTPTPGDVFPRGAERFCPCAAHGPRKWTSGSPVSGPMRMRGLEPPRGSPTSVRECRRVATSRNRAGLRCNSGLTMRPTFRPFGPRMGHTLDGARAVHLADGSSPKESAGSRSGSCLRCEAIGES
jgi:hypothetical protein